jgi:AraC-like DNA-binding protein
LRGLTGIPFTTGTAENALTSSYIELLPKLTTSLNGHAEALVREQTLDLIALSLASSPDMKAALSSALSLISMRVRAVINSGLSDPSLNVRTVARRAGVSSRHANEVLAKEGTSIARLILSSRLNRCRQALDDPRQRHRTVSEIAFSWGFCDLTHFGRRFRDTFGMPPREYRRKAFEDPRENGPIAPPP